MSLDVRTLLYGICSSYSTIPILLFIAKWESFKSTLNFWYMPSNVVIHMRLGSSAQEHWTQAFPLNDGGSFVIDERDILHY